MRATIKDIAKRVGVSSSLVSLYLNNRPLAARIAESTKRKIDAVVKELNYAPSATARALRKGKSKTLGLVVADLCSDYSSFFAQTLLDECSRYGYQLLIGITHYDPEEEKRVLANLIARQTDGIFYALRLFPADFLKSLNLQNYPILQLSSAAPEFQSMELAREEALKQCAGKLYEYGCRRVVVAHESWANILEKELEAYGIKIVGGRYATTSDDFPYLNDTPPDAVASDSSIYARLLRARCRELGIPMPYLCYSYSLPSDFIDDPRVIAVTVSDYKTRLSGIVSRMIRMLENPKEPVAHLKEPVRLMSLDELREYRCAQLKDPYYEPFRIRMRYEGN